MTTQSELVQIQLSKSEALVLFEWLAKLDEKDGNSSPDQAEQQVLWKVEGQLESALEEVLSVDFQQRVTDAKRIVLG